MLIPVLVIFNYLFKERIYRTANLFGESRITKYLFIRIGVRNYILLPNVGGCK